MAFIYKQTTKQKGQPAVKGLYLGVLNGNHSYAPHLTLEKTDNKLPLLNAFNISVTYNNVFSSFTFFQPYSCLWTYLLQDPGGLGVLALVFPDQTLRGLRDCRVWEPKQRVELRGDNKTVNISNLL